MKRKLSAWGVVVTCARAAYAGSRMHRSGALHIGLGLGLLLTAAAVASAATPEEQSLLAELKKYPYRIVHESYREDRWSLVTMDADGSNPAVLTRTPGANEMYPHVSPDGTKIVFVCDEGEGASKIRNVYYMNMDATGRTLVAKNARQPCWKSDSSAIAYLKGESDKFSYKDYATKGIVVYDLKTRKHQEHLNEKIHHLYNLCWSPDGKWFLATVHAGMGYKHAILAIEAGGMRVVNLNIPGCRPDISPDGRRLAWGPSDYALRVGDLDFSGPTPKVLNSRDILTCEKPTEIYHIDWSPDGKYVTYSRGPKKKRLGLIPEIVGAPAEDWNICVADAAKTNRYVAITTDGKSNKEPDWVTVAEEKQ